MIVFYAAKGCGGYGDRLVGMASALALADALGRPFAVALEPEYTRWLGTSPAPFDAFLNLINTHSAFEDGKVDPRPLGVAMNIPCVRGLWASPAPPSVPFEQAMRAAFQRLYTDHIRPHPSLLPAAPYAAGIHLRCGDTYCMPHALAQEYLAEHAHADVLRQCKAYLVAQGVRGAVFVASDAHAVYRHAAALSDADVTFVYFDRADDVHTDFYNSAGREHEALRDHLHLRDCAWVVTSLRSNFGATAAYTSATCRHLVYFDATDPRALAFRHVDPAERLCIKEYQ